MIEISEKEKKTRKISVSRTILNNIQSDVQGMEKNIYEVLKSLYEIANKNRFVKKVDNIYTYLLYSCVCVFMCV